METSINLKKLSKLTGYSVSTVSKALNNKSDININTKKAIRNIAIKNKYIPNSNAVALRKKKSKSIAVIMPQVNKKQFSYFLFNFQKIASEFGYKIFLFQSFEEASKEKECLNEINDGSVDGVIILSNSTTVKTDSNDNYKCPIEYIKISKNISEVKLKVESINSFMKLLNRIN